MPHDSEDTFEERVVAGLKDIYGDSRVRTKVRLEATGRVCDVWVQPAGKEPDMALELENDFEAAWKGISQALLYGRELDAEPFVVLPEGHVEVPEVFALAAGPVPIIQWPDDGQ